MREQKTAAIIVAAGRGHRFSQDGDDAPLKQLRSLAGRPVVGWSVEAFSRSGAFHEIIVVVPKDDLESFRFLERPLVKLVEGGEKRADSTRLGLIAVDPETDVVLIHDGVRPFVSKEDMLKVAEAGRVHGGAGLAVPVVDTVKRSDSEGFIAETVDRQGLWRAQTPQGFKKTILESALALAGSPEATDEASLFELAGFLGVKVKLVEGSAMNLKITGPGDLALAERLAGGGMMEDVRVGQGFDFHVFDPRRKLWLGGVLIEGEPGLAGHSDADVLAHALVDALLGAAGLGDIGVYFPPTDERYKNASGASLLSGALELVAKAGWRIANADLTLIGERPKISDHRKAMIAALSEALKIDPGLVNIKGKTTEGMGFIGRGEGLAASAVVLISKRADHVKMGVKFRGGG